MFTNMGTTNFFISAGVTSQWQAVTTFNICRASYNAWIFAYLDNIVFNTSPVILPDISKLFFLLYCPALASNLSRLTIQLSRLTLTFLKITSQLVIFSFATITWLRRSVRWFIWSQRSLTWLPKKTLPFIISICYSRCF